MSDDLYVMDLFSGFPVLWSEDMVGLHHCSAPAPPVWWIDVPPISTATKETIGAVDSTL